MTEPRPATGLLVSALIRLVEAEGGSATVLAKGDATAGAMLLLLAERGVASALIERMPGLGGYEWVAVGPADPGERDDYLARRRRNDPDLWVVEVDHARGREIVARLTS